MYYEDESRTFNFVTGLLLGAIVGAGVGLLVSPKAGKKTRRQIARAMAGVVEGAGGTWGSLADDLRELLATRRARPGT